MFRHQQFRWILISGLFVEAAFVCSISAAPSQFPKKTDSPVKAADFGDDPEKPYEETPDQSDYLETAPRQISRVDDKDEDTGENIPTASEPRVRPNDGSARHNEGILGWMRRRTSSPEGTGTRHWMGSVRDGRLAKKMVSEPDNDLGSDEDLSRYSLWSGLNVPMILPASQVFNVSPSQALIAGRIDYSKKILGERDALASKPARPVAVEGGRDSVGPVIQGGPLASKSQGMFIGIEMDISQHPGEFRDAVTQLSQSAGFMADDRFPPAFRDEKKEKVQLWGWIPSGHLHSLVNIPEITRLEIDQAPPGDLGRDTGSQVRMLLALRVPPTMLPQDILEASVVRWAREDGFSWERTVGLQRIPNSTDNAVILIGRLPVHNLDRLLADPSVVKMRPLSEKDAARGRAFLTGKREPLPLRFFSYSIQQHPVMLLLALFLSAYLIWAASKAKKRIASPITRGKKAL